MSVTLHSPAHAPCGPFRDLLRLGFATQDDAATSIQHGVREDDGALVHRAAGGPYFLSFEGKEKAVTDYEGREDFGYWKTDDYEAALRRCYEDDFRRARDFRAAIQGAGSWLDFGTGLGGVVVEYLKLHESDAGNGHCDFDTAKCLRKDADCGNGFKGDGAPLSGTRIGVIEVQSGAVAALKRHLQPRGVSVFTSPEEIPESQKFRLVTMFHVFEHLDDPVGMVKRLAEKMEDGGRLVVEVPHANDALIRPDAFDSQVFRRFTFWKEHLVLHTRCSLRAFLEDAGFEVETIQGFQRYPLANHVGWLKDGKPGGHNRHSWLRDEALEAAYADFLKKKDATDTIIAFAKKKARGEGKEGGD